MAATKQIIIEGKTFTVEDESAALQGQNGLMLEPWGKERNTQACRQTHPEKGGLGQGNRPSQVCL